METLLQRLSFTRADAVAALVVALLSMLLVGGLHYELMSEDLVRPPSATVTYAEPYP